MPAPVVTAFFDEPTFTISYVVVDPTTKHCAVIDSVWDFDPASGRTATESAERIVAFIRDEGFTTDWIIETHVHADHLSAAPYLKERLGGRIAIGAHIVTVQEVFGKIFNAGTTFERNGGQFDLLVKDGDPLPLGAIMGGAIHTPGHTPACMTYVFADAAFVGDTLFMPDFGTARCDFPGGDAASLYRSIQKIFALPDETRLFLCHDYKAPGRDEYRWETTVGEQKRANIHVREGITQEAFVRMRRERDANLAMPRLILPSVQINMRGGRKPPPEDNGVSYLKLPLDAL